MGPRKPDDGIEPKTTAESSRHQTNTEALETQEPTSYAYFAEDEVTQRDDFAHAGYPLQELPAGVRVTLSVLEGKEGDKGKVFRLEKPYNVIGRHPRSEVNLSAHTVSSRHAAIFLTRAMEWRIEDLGSKNGTVLNGSLVKRFALRSGDKMFVGDDLLQIEIDEAGKG
jgi:pSer/pThr/pTyr-binding forkhead associated (FHA) protein